MGELAAMVGVLFGVALCAWAQIAYAQRQVTRGRSCAQCYWFDVIGKEYLCGCGLGYEPISDLRTCGLFERGRPDASY